jgi:ribosomal protein S28E/S33
MTALDRFTGGLLRLGSLRLTFRAWVARSITRGSLLNVVHVVASSSRTADTGRKVMIEVKDPYKGMKYSDIIVLNETNRAKYREAPHPLRKIAGTGAAVWDASNGRHVI